MFDQGCGFEISGMVSFGDSFAAGMGTEPETTTDNAVLVDTITVTCSGDTTTGLQRQIGEWASASSANLAALTMGGNDLGFSDIVWYCLITPNTL
ncbi:esterase family protein [Penicillium fimorum]|uniref:Esterase family protein n=1 Tax=Penicillium fimorum TaxID=1882269 RepID=A0A9W9XJ40_9EURO|nr:esterase family protein [Penicillium fimorum]